MTVFSTLLTVLLSSFLSSCGDIGDDYEERQYFDLIQYFRSTSSEKISFVGGFYNQEKWFSGCPTLSEVPGVAVQWYNQANYTSGYATTGYVEGCITLSCTCYDEWYATVPLELGDNIIQFNYYDNRGRSEEFSIKVKRTP